jgi:putative transcriptional regulator
VAFRFLATCLITLTWAFQRNATASSWVAPLLILLRGRGGCQTEVGVKNSVRDLRGQLNWTQADLAEKLGVSRQTVNAIETERYDPSLPLALKIGKIFRKPVEEIFKG